MCCATKRWLLLRRLTLQIHIKITIRVTVWHNECRRRRSHAFLSVPIELARSGYYGIVVVIDSDAVCIVIAIYGWLLHKHIVIVIVGVVWFIHLVRGIKPGIDLFVLMRLLMRYPCSVMVNDDILIVTQICVIHKLHSTTIMKTWHSCHWRRCRRHIGGDGRWMALKRWKILGWVKAWFRWRIVGDASFTRCPSMRRSRFGAMRWCRFSFSIRWRSWRRRRPFENV